MERERGYHFQAASELRQVVELVTGLQVVLLVGMRVEPEDHLLVEAWERQVFAAAAVVLA